MKKRITSALLTLAMLLSLVPAMGTTAAAAEDTRPAPDRVQSYIAAPGFTATALNPNQAKFTYVEIKSNTDKDGTKDGNMTATVKCVTVTDAIAQKIGYNSGNATVNSEDLLNQLKNKLKASKDYYRPSKNTLSFGPSSNGLRHQDIGKGTFRYLLSVEAYFNGTYYFDGAGINFETRFREAYRGEDKYTVSVQVCGMTIYPDTASGEGDPPTKLKLVVDNQIGREFTNTNAAPKGNYGIQNYPDTYVANFRWMLMPNTNLEIELRNNTVLHVGKYYRNDPKSAEVKTNIYVDNLTISGNGVLLASNFDNRAYGAQGTAANSAIHANSLTVDSSNVVLDLTRDGSYNCIEVPEPSAFKPINAKSIKLAAASGKWISGLSNDETSLKNAYSAYWDTFTTGVAGEGSSMLSTVTFGRTAGLSDAALTVGGQEFERTGAVTNGEIQADGSTQSLSIAVKAPKWLTTLYKADRVGYDFTASVYENGTEIFKKVNFDLTTPDSSDGTSTVTLTLTGDFKPTAGKNYIVTFSITPKVKATGETLTDYAINGNWVLTAVEKKSEITSVNLTGNALKEGDTSGPELTSTDTSYTVATATDWNISSSGAVAGKEYYTTLTLTAEDGYVFPTDWTQLRNIISVKLGGTTITKLGLGLADGGKMLSLTVYATAKAHDHSWSGWKYDGNSHWKECSICGAKKDEGVHSLTADGSTAPGQTVTYRCECGYTESHTMPGMVVSEFYAVAVRPSVNMTLLENSVYLKNWWADVAEIVPGSIKWYKNDETTSLEVGYEFKSGEEYKVTVQFKAKDGYSFSDSMAGEGSSAGSNTGLNIFSILDYKTEVSDDKTTVTATGYYKGISIGTAHTVSVALPTFTPGEKFNDSKYNYNEIFTVDGTASSIGTVSIVFDNSTKKVEYDADSSAWKAYTRADSTSSWDTGSDATENDLTIRKGVEYTVSFKDKTQSGIYDTAKSVEVTDSGNSTTHEASFYTGSSNAARANATYFFEDDSQITSVELTVTAPEYGKTPATNATVPTGANYSANGNVSWSPEMTDGKFGTGEYTVTIPVRAEADYSFAEGCVYTVNGYTAAYADGKVSYTFPALTVPHSHSYGAWARLDDNLHSRTCNAGDDIQTAAHTWSSWTAVDGNTHKRTCNDCGAEQTANHNWVFDSQTDATFDAPGKTVYKCNDNCGVANKEEPIAQLVKIDVANLTVAKPVKDVAAAEATTTDTAYYVAATEWVAADGTTLAIGDKFKPGTAYTVKITLETAGYGVFSAASAYNQIAGKTATVSPALTGDGYTDTVILTYTFDATEGAYVPTAPSISTATLPDGKVGETYNQLLSANGSAPITWSVESGALPDGLTLAGDTIKGTPSKAGDFKFTVKATNAGGSDTKELTIKITDTEAAKYHNVTITGAGTGATGAGSHAAGTTVNIYAGTKSGYTFDGWTSDDVTVLSASSKNASFVMPDKDVTVKANWTYNGGGSGGSGYTYYTIKATAGVNGAISPSGNVSVREGRDQTFTITPDKGYAVARVLIDSKNVGAVKSYTFEDVKKNHTIEVVFMKAGGNPQTGVFVDVPEDSYYEEAVNWAVENGITTGTDATHFTPDGICTRAQAVTFLWRAAGSPAPKSTTMPFTDVKAGSYYYDAVLWAVENGITKGTSATEFSPAQNCSRAQIVTFLWRSEKSPAAGTVNPFTDVKPDAYYADAVLWAVKEDVTKGTTATTFSPDANCTRAQIVTFIWRALAE